MFNFDSFNAPNFYAGQYSYGYPPHTLPDPFKSIESPFQPQQFFNAVPAPFAFPHYSPFDKEEIKCPTVPTKESQAHEEEQQVKRIKIKSQAVTAKVEAVEDEDEESLSLEQIKLEQKYGRNIASNIFHSIIRWGTLEPAFDNITKTLIIRHKLKITHAAFKDKIKDLMARLKGYINAKTMRALFLGKRIGATRQDLDFSKLLRILGRIYMQRYHFGHVYCSSKIRKKSKFLHVKRMRIVMRLLS